MEEETKKSPIPIVSSRIVTPIQSTDQDDGALDYEPLKREGQLIFTQEDVNNSISPLDHLLRSLFVKMGVTDAYFNARHRQYANDLQMDFQTATNAKNNLMKALRKGGITFSRFIEALVNVLHLVIRDIRWEVVDEAGEVKIIDLTHGYVTKAEADEMDRKREEQKKKPLALDPTIIKLPEHIELDDVVNL